MIEEGLKPEPIEAGVREEDVLSNRERDRLDTEIKTA
jgi:hypothetical protein